MLSQEYPHSSSLTMFGGEVISFSLQIKFADTDVFLSLTISCPSSLSVCLSLSLPLLSSSSISLFLSQSLSISLSFSLPRPHLFSFLNCSIISIAQEIALSCFLLLFYKHLRKRVTFAVILFHIPTICLQPPCTLNSTHIVTSLMLMFLVFLQ